MRFPGGNSDGAPPVPIPNTEVKPVYVDGTAPETVWESRELPGLSWTPGHISDREFFCLGVMDIVEYIV